MDKKKFEIDADNTINICLMKTLTIAKKDPTNPQKIITEFWSLSGEYIGQLTTEN